MRFYVRTPQHYYLCDFIDYAGRNQGPNGMVWSGDGTQAHNFKDYATAKQHANKHLIMGAVVCNEKGEAISFN